MKIISFSTEFPIKYFIELISSNHQMYISDFPLIQMEVLDNAIIIIRCI